MRIRTYKNADEKVLAFSKRSKNVKKRTKTYEKRILSKFTFTLIRMYIWPKLHFPENLFSRIFSKQNLRLVENIFSRKLIFLKLHFLKHSFSRNYFSFEKLKNYTMFRLFISSKQNKLLVEIKKRCDNS